MTHLLLRFFSLVGLAVSSMLYVDYARPASLFCLGGRGCDVIKQSEWAHLLGIPTPAFGVAFSAVALALSLWPARRMLVAWTAVGAAAATAFIAIQVLALKALCPLCLIVDVSAIATFVLALVSRRDPAPVSSGTRGTAAVLGAVVLAAPFGWERAAGKPTAAPRAAVMPAPAFPDVVAREQRLGVVTIVEFVDFECPFCRRLHAAIKQAVQEYPGQVRIVRKHNPLSEIHENAMSSARAACCAEEQEKADEMAEALFSAPPGDIDADGCEKIAKALGLDMDKYRSCMGSRRPDERVAADLRDADAAGIAGVAPVFWVGRRKFEGARPPSVIREALASAQ